MQRMVTLKTGRQMKLQFKKKLTRREKAALVAAFTAVGIFIAWQFMASPVLNSKKRLERNLDAKTRILAEMRLLKADYESLGNQNDLSRINFGTREKGFTLFSFLDKLSGQADIKEHIAYMKPTTTVPKDGAFKLSQVEIKLSAVNLKQLTSYLYMIETSKNMVFVKRISMDQSSRPEGFIDVIMQVETYER
jgi:general secretion pathway protein M